MTMTPQVISRHLAKAGYTRSVTSITRVKGYHITPGFQVTSRQNGTVLVVYVFGNKGVRPSVEQSRQRLAQMAEYLRTLGYDAEMCANTIVVRPRLSKEAV